MKGARSIKASKGKNYRGKTASRKTGKMIYWESLLEKDYINILEFDPEVRYFESQPLMIPYFYKGKEHHYFPDFKIVTSKNQIKIVEVKPEKFLKRKKNLIKYEVGRQYCELMGFTYHVMTDENIRIGSLQSNLKKILEVDFDDIRTNTINAILDFIKKNGPIQLQTIIFSLQEFSHQELYIHIFYLIYTHQLYTNLTDFLLSECSILEINNQGGH